MNLAQRLAFYTQNYEMISHGLFGSGPKQYVGSKSSPRRCRFCEGTDLKFSSEAHAIPECLGNHQLILHEECNACNKYFSEEIEDHFDKYTRSFRTLAQIRGKKKVPSYKSRDHATRIDVSSEIRISSKIESGQVDIAEDEAKLNLALDVEPFIPVAAYKALVKMAISTIDREDELAAFKYTMRWIRDPDHSKAMMNPCNVLLTFVPGPRPIPGVESMLFRRKESHQDNIPYSIYLLAFGNIIFQAIVPSHLDDESGNTKSFAIPYIPSRFEQDWPYGPVKCGVEDWSSVERSATTRRITLSAESVTEVTGR